MAEVRKFKPGSNHITEAIQKAMGESVHPTTPGAPHDPGAGAAPAAPAPRADIFTTSTFGFAVPAAATHDDEGR